MLFVRFLRFYVLRLLTDGLRRRNIGVSRYHGTLCGTNGLRRRHLSLREERYRRKACLVVASSTSFVLPFGAKAQSFRCSSSPHQTHFVGLWRGPYWRPPLDPRSNVLGHTDVLCANLFPQGDFLRARNGAFDAIKSAAVPRSKYPWGALSLIPLPLRAALLRKTGRLTEPPAFRL